jgi:hypothetical protein
MDHSVPTAVAVTLGSSQPDGQEPPSLPLHQYNAAQANGIKVTGTAMETHHSDLTCVGTWITKGEQQSTRTLMDEGTVGLLPVHPGGIDFL